MTRPWRSRLNSCQLLPEPDVLYTFYPVNEAFYNTCADTFGTSPETVLSNGAFVLTDYQPAATAFAMEKNPDYYDADKIALDGLAYQVIKDSQQALMSYQTGTLDITLLNGEQVDQVKDDPEFTSVGAGYLWYISPNIDAVPDLANLNLRKAMTFALDRDAITGDVLKDSSHPRIHRCSRTVCNRPRRRRFQRRPDQVCR